MRSIFTKTRRGCGGIFGLTFSVIFELVLSALYAPVMMLIQTQHVFDILTGSDSDWVTQRRQAAALSWRDAWHFHWKHSLVGIVIAGVAYLLSPTLLAWLTPAIAGLMLAIPLSKISGSARVGEVVSRLAIFRIPEETAPHKIIRRRQELMAQAVAAPADGLQHLARDAQARAAHLAGNLPRPLDQRGHPNPNRLTADEKVSQAATLHEALSWLSGQQRIEVAADARLLERLAALPD
jgi:membrane glycosyltransferase